MMRSPQVIAAGVGVSVMVAVASYLYLRQEQRQQSLDDEAARDEAARDKSVKTQKQAVVAEVIQAQSQLEVESAVADFIVAENIAKKSAAAVLDTEPERDRIVQMRHEVSHAAPPIQSRPQLPSRAMSWADDPGEQENEVVATIAPPTRASINGGWTSPRPGDPTSTAAKTDSNHSELSADSGTASTDAEWIVFKFDFPAELVGLLIGKQGKNVKLLEESTGANISLKRVGFTQDFQLCTIEGSATSVDKCLDLITEKFPEIDLSKCSTDVPSAAQPPRNGVSPRLAVTQNIVDIPQLRLPENTMSDVYVSSIVSAGHVFLQQHTHPFFQELSNLHSFMMTAYTDANVPSLPAGVPPGVICAAPSADGQMWCRAIILHTYDDTASADIRYADFGSFATVSLEFLKQIRSDFLQLPFLATECYIANIVPKEGDESFSEEALYALQGIVEGQMLLANVKGYAEDNKPIVDLLLRDGKEKKVVARTLADEGHVTWQEA